VGWSGPGGGAEAAGGGERGDGVDVDEGGEEDYALDGGVGEGPGCCRIGRHRVLVFEDLPCCRVVLSEMLKLKLSS